jgi:hypothetical protein
VAQRKILLDSNAYFRLAQTFHPLLHVEFGEDCHCLYVIRELQQEFNRSSRLQTKFFWVSEAEYVENRSRTISIPSKAARTIKLTLSVILGHSRREGLGASRVDAAALATAYALGIPVVTDDGDMLTLAKAFTIEAMKTLELLRLMVDCGRATTEQVVTAASYWGYSNDLPKGYGADFKRLFKQQPP